MRSRTSVSGHSLGRLLCTASCSAALLGAALAQVASAEGPYALSKSSPPQAVCPEGAPGDAECMAIRVPTVPASSPDAIGPALSGGGELGGYAPKELREAYGLPATGGASQTIALIDAFNDPNAEADLQKYREKYKTYFKAGETACTEANGCFKKVNQSGETKNFPENNKEWSEEISLDLDMVSAACPECHILLVESTSEHSPTLAPANEEAFKLKATEINNSWGDVEFSGETADDKYLEHPGIPVTASGGDVEYNGCDHKPEAGICYPAASPNVIAVGGTKLTRESKSTRGWAEEVWLESPRGKGTGSGCSIYEPKPQWQQELPLVDSYCEKRLDNDVAADASNESPVSVYDTYERSGWMDMGGTSAAAPLVAAVEALSSEYARDIGPRAFYIAGPKSLLFDVTEGENGGCTLSKQDKFWCHAEVGYDGPTGWGTLDGTLNVTGAPFAITGSTTSIAKREASLSGTVNPGGLETKYWFEYGTTVAYGKKTTESNAGAGVGNLLEGRTVTGLEPSTAYHFRVVAKNAAGTVDGADQTFTTTERTWSVQTTPNPTGAKDSTFQSVSCTSGSACTAVGPYRSSEGYVLAMAERWNGVEWSLQTTPKPSEATNTYLEGVSCLSATECTAVGDKWVNTKSETLVEHWNGSEWSLQIAPNPTGAKFSTLEAVACRSASACVAVGWYENAEGEERTLAEGWNGKEWTIQSTPAKRGRERSVSCSASNACTAVSGMLVERWNGTTWSAQTIATPAETEETRAENVELEGVSCLSATACTAAGHYWKWNSNKEGAVGRYYTLIETWNGSEWTVQASANVPGDTSRFEAVSCTSATACSAVGYYTEATHEYTLAEGWNGTKWTIQQSANVVGAPENYLHALSCASSTECIAAGEAGSAGNGSGGKSYGLAEIFS